MSEVTGPTTPLFDPDELAKWMGIQVSRSRAEFLGEQVSARFLDKAGLDAWPTPAPPVVKSWAIEYAALYYENPTALSDDRAGETFQRWNPRAQEIIAELKEWAQRRSPSTGGGGPVGQFPPARPFPDPVEVWPRW